ncbi:MAG: uracil-DNA glycosylase [Rhodospirillaceae bacterium]
MVRAMNVMEAENLAPDALLRWYLEAGVDEAVGEEALDRYALSAAQAVAKAAASPPAAPQGSRQAAPAPRPPAAPALADSPRQAAHSAAHQAAAAKTLQDLRQTLERFEGCPLKATATHTVFGDGNPGSAVMVIGELPGRDEDRLGMPFVGPSGALLDRMLGSIGLTRDTVYLTTVLPWRPPGNRTPTEAEIAVCVPFLERHIELVQPKVLLLVGGLAAKIVFARPDGIMKLRGRWQNHATPGLSHPIPAIATFTPDYLMNSTVHKRLAWRDLLDLKQKLRELGVEEAG